MEIKDVKPKMGSIDNTKPKSLVIKNDKPKTEMSGKIDQLYEVVITSGMLIGLGPHITYSEAQTVITPKSS